MWLKPFVSLQSRAKELFSSTFIFQSAYKYFLFKEKSSWIIFFFKGKKYDLLCMFKNKTTAGAKWKAIFWVLPFGGFYNADLNIVCLALLPLSHAFRVCVLRVFAKFVFQKPISLLIHFILHTNLKGFLLERTIFSAFNLYANIKFTELDQRLKRS